jgi:tRNA(Ile)-lysidine synthase
MDLLEHFTKYIQEKKLFQKKDRLLLAVSGGLDSVVLCDLCKKSGFDFAVSHCNFQLRGEESTRDLLFTEALAKKLNVAFYSKTFDTSAVSKTEKKSVEETARDLRYHWFEELRQQQQFNYILTAHHADDNIETVVMNFFRGTGIKGLHGILPKHGKIIRPLLFAKRKELETYLQENKLKHIVDYTNAETDFTRNYFRNTLLPLVYKHYPEAEKNITANIQRFNEVEQLYEESILFHKKKLIEFRDNEAHIPVLKLQKSTPLKTIIYEIIKDYGFTAHQTDEVCELLQSGTG